MLPLCLLYSKFFNLTQMRLWGRKIDLEWGGKNYKQHNVNLKEYFHKSSDRRRRTYVRLEPGVPIVLVLCGRRRYFKFTVLSVRCSEREVRRFDCLSTEY